MSRPFWLAGLTSGYGTGAVLALLLIIQLFHFTAGYRLTDDDAMFLQYAWRGCGHVWEAARGFAYLTGRVGQFFMTPLNAFGAYWADNGIARVLMVLSYFGVMVLFACYASRLLAAGAWRVTAFILLSMLSLHPLAYEHMPPNAYPLQNTVPFLLVLAIRLWLWNRNQVAMPLLVGLYAVQSIAMLFSEYVILFATALMAVEHLNNAASPKEAQHKLFGVPVRYSRLLADVLLVVFVLSVYLLFQTAFPSQYEGNTIDALPDARRFLLTSVYHVLSGLAFYRLSLSDMATATWAAASLVSLITFAIAWYLLAHLPFMGRKKALITILVTVFIMLYMAFPLAATSRQQELCLELNSCGYLDSRSSFLGVGVLLYCIAGLLLTRSSKRTIAPILATLLAVMAGLNHVSNQRVANDMLKRSMPWKAASELACEMPSGAVVRSELQSMIDPHELISFHPYVDPQVYWLEYMNHLRSSGHCGAALAVDQAMLRDPFHLPISDPGFISVGDLRGIGAEALGEGWSQIESWGVWSDEASSSLILDLADPALANVSALEILFNIYLGPSVSEQQVDVWIDDEWQQNWTFSEENSKDCCRRRIQLSDHVGQQEVEVRLSYEHQRNFEHPNESSDPRPLALGLRLLELVEQKE
ncbi:hypothetical protein J7J49_06675 [Halomonas sp. ISL-56]|uniref:hypothetical protein n=1 Tax=Halomonas sp. ISL-56 TaxID=2819149 RepID=UPI001BE9D356|nr:hypothetical protein [Halomonas sp. ISL-56]MBT2801001.1 hypothetical protein [Halomonas sp. ISL-56]